MGHALPRWPRDSRFHFWLKSKLKMNFLPKEHDMENSPLDAGAIGFLLKSTGECEMSRKRASPSDSNDPINRWGRGGDGGIKPKTQRRRRRRRRRRQSNPPQLICETWQRCSNSNQSYNITDGPDSIMMKSIQIKVIG